MCKWSIDLVRNMSNTNPTKNEDRDEFGFSGGDRGYAVSAPHIAPSILLVVIVKVSLTRYKLIITICCDTKNLDNLIKSSFMIDGYTISEKSQEYFSSRFFFHILFKKEVFN